MKIVTCLGNCRVPRRITRVVLLSKGIQNIIRFYTEHSSSTSFLFDNCLAKSKKLD